jgi:hypothetical protein
MTSHGTSIALRLAVVLLAMLGASAGPTPSTHRGPRAELLVARFHGFQVPKEKLQEDSSSPHHGSLAASLGLYRPTSVVRECCVRRRRPRTGSRAAATGEQTSGHGSALFTIDGGKIANVVSHFDAEDLFRQLVATIRAPP